jgi:hypothetical protein
MIEHCRLTVVRWDWNCLPTPSLHQCQAIPKQFRAIHSRGLLIRRPSLANPIPCRAIGLRFPVNHSRCREIRCRFPASQPKDLAHLPLHLAIHPRRQANRLLFLEIRFQLPASYPRFPAIRLKVLVSRRPFLVSRSMARAIRLLFRASRPKVPASHPPSRENHLLSSRDSIGSSRCRPYRIRSISMERF